MTHTFATFEELLDSGMSVDKRPVEFLPEPTARPRKYLIFSVDDHVCESPDAFTSRVPRKFAEAAPHVVVNDVGEEAWLVDGVVRRWIGADSIVGRRLHDQDDLERSMWLGDMRPGTYDVHHRIADMDLDGVFASVTFPSMVWGFCGQKVWGHRDAELGLACVRAYNDWLWEEWAAPYPERIIPASIPYLPDPQLAAEEVRRNAARGFKAVHFFGEPREAGLPLRAQ